MSNSSIEKHIPFTSIVILTYNKLEYTKVCIESIRKYTKRRTYQLILVDNASTDGTREWLAEQTDILTIFNEENVGFPKGCNQGIELANGDNILLLNNDVLVTENWLESMNECLYSAEDIGAVGPVTNSAYGDQEIDVAYSSLNEMWDFANGFNSVLKQNWEQRLKLIGFCMLIKREVIETIGVLDEIFSPGMCEDSDYSFRIIQGGYKLLLCHNVFVHHFGSTSFGEMPKVTEELWNRNRETFKKKWGFHTAYHTQPREDIVELIKEPNRLKAIRVLDVGCACGSTLLKIRYNYPNAQLYGIEKNAAAAAIAGTFATVTAGDAETVALENESFDYIILGDVLHQMIDPWRFISKVESALVKNGEVLASMPNASHYSVIFSLLKEKSLYGMGEILDQDQLRIFTSQGIQDLFDKAGLKKSATVSVQGQLSDAEQHFVKQLASLTGSEATNRYSVRRYLVSACKEDKLLSVAREILELIHKNGRIESVNEAVLRIIELSIDSSVIIKAMEALNIDKQLVYNILVNKFFELGLFNDIVPLLNASLEINPNHHDTLYNYAFILHSVGADESALQYLNRIEHKDVECFSLLERINVGIRV